LRLAISVVAATNTPFISTVRQTCRAVVGYMSDCHKSKTIHSAY
jgi:hypothetical protein